MTKVFAEWATHILSCERASIRGRPCGRYGLAKYAFNFDFEKVHEENLDQDTAISLALLLIIFHVF